MTRFLAGVAVSQVSLGLLLGLLAILNCTSIRIKGHWLEDIMAAACVWLLIAAAINGSLALGMWIITG